MQHFDAYHSTNITIPSAAEHYGFVMADNPHDAAHMPFEAFSDTFAAHMKQNPSRSGHSYLHCNGVPSWQLLQSLRYCMASSAEKKKCGHLAAAGERISVAGDIQVCSVLQNDAICNCGCRASIRSICYKTITCMLAFRTRVGHA